MRTIYNRNWSTPISLTRNQPITKSILGFKFAKSFFFSKLCNFISSIDSINSIKLLRINQVTFFCVRFVFLKSFAIDYLNHRKIVFFSKSKISFIMIRNCHNSACTIINKSIICNPNRTNSSCKWIYNVSS